MKKRYYIAYGSNLNVRQMHWRCPDARVVGTGELRDWRLLFRGSKTGAYLTIEHAEGFRVPVAVWEVSENDERMLDRYEGFPSFYYKKEMTIDVKGIHSGRTRRRKVFVYIMHEDRPLGKATTPYLATCFEGYRTFGFDQNLLFQACNYRREVNRYNERR